MRNKYGNTKYKGYDSKKEYYRSNELKLLQRAGEITDLKEQVKYELIPSQYEVVNGKKKCIEKEISYYADFQYIKNGETVVEDTKSSATITKDYIIKRKLMLYVHGIKIKEV